MNLPSAIGDVPPCSAAYFTPALHNNISLDEKTYREGRPLAATLWMCRESVCFDLCAAPKHLKPVSRDTMMLSSAVSEGGATLGLNGLVGVVAGAGAVMRLVEVPVNETGLLYQTKQNRI